MIVNVELKLTVQLSHFSSHTFELLVINLVGRSFRQGLERAEEVNRFRLRCGNPVGLSRRNYKNKCVSRGRRCRIYRNIRRPAFMMPNNEATASADFLRQM